MTCPNVLILCSDEHSPRYTGCYGHPAIVSPTLDKLSKRGTTFDNAYSPSPICVPARACLATGLQVHQTGCWSSAQAYHGQVESRMHQARNFGFTVVSFGKLHFRGNRDDNGFNEEILPMHLAFDGVGWPTGLLRDPLPVFQSAHELAELTGCGESEYTEYDRRITEATCDWLRKSSNQSRQKPWVLFVSFVSPHYPLTAPEPFYRLYEHSDRLGRPILSPANGYAQHPVLKEVRGFWNYDDFFTDDLRIEARKNYFGLISFLDDNIKQVLKALEAHNNSRDTLILYTSYHGEMLGHLGFWAKSVMHERSVGVPLIATGGGFERQRCDAPVSLTNINNTVLEAIGIERIADTSCLDESLQSVASSPEVPRFTFSEYHEAAHLSDIS